MREKGVLQERGGLWSGRRWVFESLPSTNRWALGNSKLLRHGDIVVARQQTAGRGRFDRIWQSPGDRNLTVSFCLDFSSPTPPTLLPAAAAMATRSTLAKAGAPARLKWPNDVLCNDRKIAGILCEQDPSISGRVIVGIGINIIFATDIPVQSGHLPAISLQQITGENCWTPEKTQEKLIKEMEILIQALQQLQHKILNEWRRYDALDGKQLVLNTAAGDISGEYAGVDELGRLILKEQSGKHSHHWSGDVSIRAKHQ